MKIIGFGLSKVSYERKNPIKGKIEIKSGLNIDNISKEDLQISENDSLKFDFTYEINYNPDIASIIIKGSVIAVDDKKESKEILKDWKKKKFDHPIKLNIFNFIMDKCNLKSLLMEEELGLPLHIPMPKLAPKPSASDSKSENKANYAG